MSVPLVARSAWGELTAPVTPRARRVASAAWAERRPSTTTAATPAPAAASKAASQPRIDLDQVEQGAHHAVDFPEEFAPAGALEVAQGPLERLGPGGGAVAGLLGFVDRDLRRLGVGAGLLEVGGALGQGGGEAGGGDVGFGGAAGEQVGPHGGGLVTLLECGHPAVQPGRVLLLAGGGALEQVGAGLGLGGGVLRRVPAQDRGPAGAKVGLLLVEGGQRGGEGGAFRLRPLPPRRRPPVGSDVRRGGLSGFQGGDDV